MDQGHIFKYFKDARTLQKLEKKVEEQYICLLNKNYVYFASEYLE